MNDIWVSCQKAPNEDWLDAEKWLLSDHGNIKVPRISLLKWLCPGKPLEQIARFLCLWAHESGSLEDVTNTLKAEAVFLFFWFKARTPTLLAFYWSQLHMIFLFISWLGYKLFFFNFCMCLRRSYLRMCAGMYACAHTGRPEESGVWSSAANQQTPGILFSLPPMPCVGILGKHVVTCFVCGCWGFKLRSCPLNDFSSSNFSKHLVPIFLCLIYTTNLVRSIY